jgi:hypothetical protein
VLNDPVQFGDCAVGTIYFVSLRQNQTKQIVRP